MAADDVPSMMSGVPLPVVEVDGQLDVRLTALLGEVGFIVEQNETRCQIWGVGKLHGDGVRFHQKDPDNHGRDVRIWNIRQDPDGRGYLATHDAAI